MQKIGLKFCLLSVLLSFMFAGSDAAATGTPEIYDRYGVTTDRWEFAGYASGTSVKNLLYASSTNDVYIIGAVEERPNMISHTIRKLSSSGHEVFTVGYQYIALDKTAFLSANEAFIYYLVYGTDAPIVQVSTSDGSTISVKKMNGMVCLDARGGQMKPNPDKTSVYVSVTRQGVSNYLGRHELGSSIVDCYEIETSITIQAIEVIGITNIFSTTSGYGASSFLKFQNLNFDSGTFEWSNVITYPGITSTNDFGLAKTNEAGDTIFTVSEYGTTIYFQAFSVSDGSSVGSRYESIGSCTEAYGLYVYTKVYVSMFGDSDTNHILVFDPEFMEYSHFKTDNNFNINHLSIDPIYSK